MSEPTWTPEIAPTPTRRAVVAVALQGPRLLVIRRSQFVRAPGHYCFPGGGIEPGENCEEAIVREMREELTLDVTPLRQLWVSRTRSGFELNWWQVDVVEAQEIVPNMEEVEWWGWCRPAEFLAFHPLLPSNEDFMQAWLKKEFVLS
ncbi:MAG: NUDIX hydrolase [Pirellulaceae bacterium]|nr:NUDIX hydrolase [Pirellulaceae bacterium]